MRLALALLALTLASPALAGPRPLTVCLQADSGEPVTRGVVWMWSEKLEIPRDAENRFRVGDDGCVTVESLAWQGRPFPLMAWIEVVYRGEAEGHHPVNGRFTLRRKKKQNRVTLMLEPE